MMSQGELLMEQHRRRQRELYPVRAAADDRINTLARQRNPEKLLGLAALRALCETARAYPRLWGISIGAAKLPDGKTLAMIEAEDLAGVPAITPAAEYDQMLEVVTEDTDDGGAELD